MSNRHVRSAACLASPCWAWGAIAAMLVVLPPAIGHGQQARPTRLALRWFSDHPSAPCAPRERVQAAVLRRAAGDIVLAAEDDGVLTVTGTVAGAKPGPWQADMVVSSNGTVLGRRSLRSSGDCAVFEAQLAVVLSMLVSEGVRAEAEARRRPLQPGAEISVPLQGDTEDTFGLDTALAARLDVDDTGRVSPGVAAEAILAPADWWSIVLGAFLARTSEVRDDHAVARTIQLLAQAAVCPLRVGHGRWAHDACAAIDAGAEVVTSEGLDSDGTRLVPALRARLSYRVRFRVVDDWSLSLGLHGGVPITRPVLKYRTAAGQERILHPAPEVFAGAWAGASYRFR